MFDYLSDVELQVKADGLRLNLSRAWQRGEAGSIRNLYDLARVTAEAQVRGFYLTPLAIPGQMSIEEEMAPHFC